MFFPVGSMTLKELRAERKRCLDALSYLKSGRKKEGGLDAFMIDGMFDRAEIVLAEIVRRREGGLGTHIVEPATPSK